MTPSLRLATSEPAALAISWLQLRFRLWIQLQLLAPPPHPTHFLPFGSAIVPRRLSPKVANFIGGGVRGMRIVWICMRS